MSFDNSTHIKVIVIVYSLIICFIGEVSYQELVKKTNENGC